MNDVYSSVSLLCDAVTIASVVMGVVYAIRDGGFNRAVFAFASAAAAAIAGHILGSGAYLSSCC